MSTSLAVKNGGRILSALFQSYRGRPSKSSEGPPTVAESKLTKFGLRKVKTVQLFKEQLHYFYTVLPHKSNRNVFSQQCKIDLYDCMFHDDTKGWWTCTKEYVTCMKQLIPPRPQSVVSILSITTVEARLTATSVIRSPRYYYHLMIIDKGVSVSQQQSFYKKF